LRHGRLIAVAALDNTEAFPLPVWDTAATLLVPTCITREVLVAAFAAGAFAKLTAFGCSGRASIAADSVVFAECAAACSAKTALFVSWAINTSLALAGQAAIVRNMTALVAMRMRTPSICEME
jgi:hypothetical protein